MAPRKKDREGETSKNGKNDQQYETFLNAFEKPTQIYRFFHTRNDLSPSFLHRNLNFIKVNIPSVPSKKPEEFKVDTLLEIKQRKIRADSLAATKLGKYMRITFLGIKDTANEWAYLQQNVVSVETVLMKVSNKKRKVSADPQVQNSLGVFDVTINPEKSGLDLNKVPALSIPSEAFKPMNDTNNRCVLVFKIQVLPKYDENTANGDEPTFKRLKLYTKIFGCECYVFNKKNECLLIDGDYSIALEEIVQNAQTSEKKHSTWEVDVDESAVVFEDKPALQFKVQWTKDECESLIDRPQPQIESKTDASNKENQQKTVAATHSKRRSNVRSNGVIFQFVYGKDAKLQTKEFSGFTCPMCKRNCYVLYGLLKHLTLSHPRLLFTLLPGEQHRIDVMPNDLYDGSYSGSPHDLTRTNAANKWKGVPVRRTTVTQLMVFHPRKPKYCLSEFHRQDDNELTNQRHYISGHGNRMYHHNMTCLPIEPKDLDHDSEDESDPLWLREKTLMMIDEFSDVNDGEKEIMKMWNLHVMKHSYIADCQLQEACERFVADYGKCCLKNNLYRNFVMHLTSIFDYNLISSEGFYRIVQQLQRILSTYDDGKSSMADARRKQMDYWLAIGEMKQKILLSELAKISAKAATNSTPVAGPSGTKMASVGKRMAEAKDDRSKASGSGSKKEKEAETAQVKRKYAQIRDESGPSRRRCSGNAQNSVAGPSKTLSNRRQSVAQRRSNNN